jgi:glycosyltransferase involved in cell wall biosynthesis
MTPVPRSLAYVIGTYPLLTTTFIDREITALRRWGVDVQVLAMRRPPSGMPLSNTQRDLQEGVSYLLPVAWNPLLTGHAYYALRRPLRYAATLADLLTCPHPDLRSRIKTLLHFGEGVYAAYLLRGRHVRELHAHFLDRAATVAMVAGRLLDRPYSLSIHAGADVFVAPVLVREKIMRARSVVTCTLHNKAHLEEIAGPDVGAKVTPVRHGLDLDEYGAVAIRLEPVPVILGVGQLTERKGFAQLVRACASLRDQGYELRCRIVGDGPQRAELRRLIGRLGLDDRVTLCGALPHDRVIEQFGRATVFALPCLQTGGGDVDGIPNALAEAMAVGLPVVSTSLPAIRELVSDGVDGLLVPPGDDDALAGAVRRLLEEPALRRRLGARARDAVAEGFDAQANVRRFGSVLWPDWFRDKPVTA